MQVHCDNMPGWEGTCEVRAFVTGAWKRPARVECTGRLLRRAARTQSAAMTAADTHRTIVAVWRSSSRGCSRA